MIQKHGKNWRCHLNTGRWSFCLAGYSSEWMLHFIRVKNQLKLFLKLTFFFFPWKLENRKLKKIFSRTCHTGICKVYGTTHLTPFFFSIANDAQCQSQLVFIKPEGGWYKFGFIDDFLKATLWLHLGKVFGVIEYFFKATFVTAY